MNKIDILKARVRQYYSSSDPAHNWNHILRVTKLAHDLALNENADIYLTQAAALCHDLINLPKNDPKRAEASTMSSLAARPILVECGFNEEEISIIQEAIITHSYSKGLKPTSIEGMIVQDADRLDALGAIGILRCTSVSTHFGADYYDSNNFWAIDRDLDDKNFMIDHYQTKLFKLVESMNTQSAKTEGEKRIQFMKLFLSTLHSEVLP